jgi:hypothetical protein
MRKVCLQMFFGNPFNVISGAGWNNQTFQRWYIWKRKRLIQMQFKLHYSLLRMPMTV